MFFRDIIGQQEVKQRLIHSVAAQRISHAQLFFGKEGAGALPLAFAYARYIHCTSRNETDACGECSSCRKYNTMVHPDQHFVFPVFISKQREVSRSADLMKEWRTAFSENPYLTYAEWGDCIDAENKQLVIGTEESGEILRKLSLTTFEGGYKIMIIWLPEKMNAFSSNKLLKILEEPPDKTLFFLVTENEEELLRTIVSRTQLLKIPAIADDALRPALVKRHHLSEADAEKIAFQSEGSYAAAMQLINRNENAEYYFDTFRKWMRACLKFDSTKVVPVTEDIATIGREKQKQFLSYALNLIRESLLLNYGDAALVRIAGEELDFIRKFSPYIHAANGKQFMEELDRAIGHISRNGSAKIIFLDLSFRMNELLNIPKPQPA